MLFPDQVVPFLQHDDPIVRDHALRYFHDSYDFGPLLADHFWAVIDRFGENDQTLGFATHLADVPQTDASVHRLLNAFESNPSDNFEFHYQVAARNMELAALVRNRDRVLGCTWLLPHVRAHLERRLRLLDQSPGLAWEQLMECGRALGTAYAMSFDASESDALVEAASRGGPGVCAKAMEMLNDAAAREDWREIFTVRVLGEARYEPAIDALVRLHLIDTDVLREQTNNALTRIGTAQVIEKLVAFYPAKPWHVRLYARSPLERLKRVESEAGLLTMLQVELAIEANEDSDNDDEYEEYDEYEDEDEPLIDAVLQGLSHLCSLSGLEESRRFISSFPDDPEAIDLCQCMLATATMCGVALPEEPKWRSLIRKQQKRHAAGMRDAQLTTWGRSVRDRWRETGISLPPGDEPIEPQARPSSRDTPVSEPGYDPYARLEPIRNTSPKIGRNDPCPCGSGKKYKKCCGK